MSTKRLKVEGGKFFLVEAGDGQWIHATKEGAIDTLTDIIQESDDINPEDTRITEVDSSGEKWSITSVPWAEVAFGLIRKGK